MHTSSIEHHLTDPTQSTPVVEVIHDSLSEHSILENTSDSKPEDALLLLVDPKTSQEGSPPLAEDSKVSLNLIKCLVEVLDIKKATEVAKVMDVVHKLVQDDLPPFLLLPMLPVHVDSLNEA